MKEIIVPKINLWDEKKERVIIIDETKLQLEHSLISLKKWESRWHKPFLSDDERTIEEIKDYVRCMTINQIKDKRVFEYLPNDLIVEIIEYIKDPMTATRFSKDSNVGAAKSKKEIITAEIIYYWMISLNIPVEFQKWHLNQLLTLIKVVNIKTSPKKKKDKRDTIKWMAAENARRRAMYNSRG